MKKWNKMLFGLFACISIFAAGACADFEDDIFAVFVLHIRAELLGDRADDDRTVYQRRGYRARGAFAVRAGDCEDALVF